MTAFGCCFWWFVVGMLLGWLGNWFLGRFVGRNTITPDVSPPEPVASPPAAVPGPGDVDMLAARAAGFMVSGSDNLEVIEGIGPKIGHLLRSHSVTSFSKLASMHVDAIELILRSGGIHFNLADPRTWPEQAALAATNRWQELRELQDRIFSGAKI
jgi:predicted flap endonuclease-1-like 5' DNA nuclease